MKTLRFKTNAKCGGCVNKIGSELSRKVLPKDWSIDLNSPDRVLTVQTDLPAETIVSLVNTAGFKAGPLG